MIAQVHLIGSGLLGPRHTFGLEAFGGHLGEIGDDRTQLVAGEVDEGTDEGAGALRAQTGRGIAVRAEDSGRRRDDDRPGTGEPAERVRVQRPGPTERHQGEIAGVVALLDAHQAQCAEHVLVDDVDHPGRRGLGGRESHGVGDRRDRCAGGVDVELHLTTGEVAGQVAQDDVGVGDGRFGAAVAVGGRAGIGDRRLRSDAQRLGQLGDVGDGTATGADGSDVDTGRADREVTDLGLAADARLAVEDERDVGGRAAHVEGEEVGVPGLLGEPHRTGHAAGRPRQQQRHRVLGGLTRLDQAAVTAQDRQRRRDPLLLERRVQVLDVSRDLRLHIAVGDRGQGALVFAHLRQDVRRQRDRDVGQLLGHPSSDLFLVVAVRIGVDQRHRDGLDVRAGELAQFAAGLLLVERGDLTAVGADPADHLNGVLELGQRFGFRPDDTPGESAGYERPRDLQDVTEPVGGKILYVGGRRFRYSSAG